MWNSCQMIKKLQLKFTTKILHVQNWNKNIARNQITVMNFTFQANTLMKAMITCCPI